MTFFNKKEEVIEIELTSFGKSLHSRGRLKPAYYAFFDDDVIYDGEYGSSDEDADTRIRINTPRRRIQHNFTSVEDVQATEEQATLANYGISSNVGSVAGFENRSANELLQEERTKEILIQEQKRRDAFPPIGTSANSSIYHPAWKAFMLQGELSSSVPYIDMGASVIEIPQMDVKKRDFTIKAMRGSDENAFLYGYVFEDGSSVTLKETSDSEFLLFLQEENADSDSENFTIEMFEVDESSGEQNLVPLDFAKNFGSTDMIIDGMFVESDSTIVGLNPADDPSLVGYYFDVEVDTEINPAILTEAFQSGRFTDMRDLESFMNSARFKTGDRARTVSGGSASDIYGLSLAEIAQLNEDSLRALQKRVQPDPAGMYNQEDKADGCD